MTWFYLSFADPQKPSGEQFLGAAYVNADGEQIVDVMSRLSAIGINPGGEILIAGPIGEEEIDDYLPQENRERLLTRAEIKEMDDVVNARD